MRLLILELCHRLALNAYRIQAIHPQIRLQSCAKPKNQGSLLMRRATKFKVKEKEIGLTVYITCTCTANDMNEL